MDLVLLWKVRNWKESLCKLIYTGNDTYVYMKSG